MTAKANNGTFRFSIGEFLIAVAAVSIVLGGFTLLGFFGGTCAVLTVGALLFFYGQRTKRKWMTGLGAAISVAAGLFLGALIAGWVMFGIGPVINASAHPFEFTEMAEISGADISDCKIFGLGSFIDQEHVWRISLSPEQVDRVIKDYGLVEVADQSVPRSFLSRFPYHWRPQRNNHSRFLATPSFPAQGRGPDGEHYFTMYDAKNQHLYVWYKFNF